MILALQGGHEVPFEWVTMQLAERFHCLPSEIEQMPYEKISLYLDMINIESQFQSKEQRLEEQKLKVSKHKF